MESNNEGEFERHFRDHYIPETFPHDSLLDLYVRMYFQWDSIGVTNRFDHWWVRYVSPFAPGAVYDVAIAAVRLRHHQARIRFASDFATGFPPTPDRSARRDRIQVSVAGRDPLANRFASAHSRRATTPAIAELRVVVNEVRV